MQVLVIRNQNQRNTKHVKT